MTGVGLVERIREQLSEQVWPGEGCGSGKERDSGSSAHRSPSEVTVHHNGIPGLEGLGKIADTIGNLRAPHARVPVSYTHLTLPTILRV